MFDENADEFSVLHLTADVVSAYVSNHTVRTAELADVIRSVAASLQEQGRPEPEVTSAVPVRRSISKDFIVCLECGKKKRTLKRHLATAHGLTPEEYRQKYRLSADYPLVAPSYAEQRSALAKATGLGQRREKKGVGEKQAVGRRRTKKRTAKAA